MQIFLTKAKEEIKREAAAALLPKFLIDLRRSEAWSDALLNPKGSLYLGFATAAESARWLLGNMRQASEGTTGLDDENFSKRLRILQSNHIRERLGNLDRVTLSIQTTALDTKNPALIFSSKNGGPAKGFCLYPRTLPLDLKGLGFHKDPLLFQDALHFLPSSLALAQCARDEEPLPPSPPDPSVLTKPDNLDNANRHRPASFLAASSEERLFPSLDPVVESELRELRSALPELSASYAFDFITTEDPSSRSSPYPKSAFTGPIL